ncbi:hypothetical protein [Streptacidiphilus anmyonensis]|uniref:hypothetical protein n=1 Tax=Streptacidiphilus anmyonensis TaxID=405782 RepID=UPI000A713F7F|nr:hypothetical protein [Streptacidiphilus anmyonensis]
MATNAEAAVMYSVSTYSCKVSLDIIHNYNGSGHDYAAATITSVNGDCLGALWRSSDGGKTWLAGSTDYYESPGHTFTTSYYYDGPGYVSKAHIQENDGWGFADKFTPSY